MLDPEPVTCRKVGDAPFARIFAVCHVGDTNVNEALVRAGLALTYIEETDAYVAVEKAAERERRGYGGAISSRRGTTGCHAPRLTDAASARTRAFGFACH